MKLVPLLVVLFLLVGCPGRATGPKAVADQAAVEAASGMAAAQAMLGAAMTPQLADVLNGSAAFARATIGQDVAPAAVWTPEKIAAQPHDYLQAGITAERKANGSWNRWALGVLALTVMPTVLWAAKFIPGVGPYVETFGGLAWKILASRATKDQEDQRDLIYAHASTIFHTAVQALPTPAAAAFEAKIPRPVIEAIMSAPPQPPAG